MKRAIAIAAHPDDIEFLMSGTMLALKDAGFELHTMNLSDGCCGSMDHAAETIAEIRLQEAQQAAEKMGAKFHGPISTDMGIFHDQYTIRRLASVIRAVAPTIILTHALADYMEDHMNTARLAVTAAFTRGMPNYKVDPSRPITHEPVTIYHAQPYGHRDPLRCLITPEIYVDVTDLVEQKVELLACHASQKDWLDKSQGVDSYLTTLKQLDAELGTMSGKYQYAEGWSRHLHQGFCEVDDDPLADALAARITRSGE